MYITGPMLEPWRQHRLSVASDSGVTHLVASISYPTPTVPGPDAPQLCLITLMKYLLQSDA